MMRINNFNLSPLEVLFLFSGYMTHLNTTLLQKHGTSELEKPWSLEYTLLPNFSDREMEIQSG